MTVPMPEKRACEKCGSDDEHLHYFCRGCGFDWTGDVLGGAS